MKINWFKVAKVALPAAASAGVVLTAALSGKAVVKAHNVISRRKAELYEETHRGGMEPDFEPMSAKEEFKASWKCYIPPVVSAACTIAAIIGEAVIFKQREASLLAACALAVADKNRWIQATEEEFGEEGKRKVEERVIHKANMEQKITSTGFFTTDCLDWDVHDEKLRTFYDQFGDILFESTIAKVLEAEYHLNRNLVLKGDISCKEFYDFLGIDIDRIRPDLEENHWDVMSGEYCWVDFNHVKAPGPDGSEVFIIEMDWEPDTSWREVEFGDSYRPMPPSEVLSPKELDQGPSAR